MSENKEATNIGTLLNPDIIQATLPFLSPSDLRNLSLTNKYFHKLLNYESSDTLWHELYHKVYNTIYTNDEPFQSNLTNEYKTCSEAIMSREFNDKSWHDIYNIRSRQTRVYTWGCMKHGRLGYNSNTNPELTEDMLNQSGFRVKSGVNQPVSVPWVKLDDGNNNIDDFAVAQVSGGGFSFQILTKSGKVFSTGSTFSGGYDGPGPVNGELDYNPFRSLIEDLENSLPRIRVGNRVNTTGRVGGRPMGHYGPTPIAIPPHQAPTPGSPHQDIYAGFIELEKSTNQTIDGNDQIKRMFPRNAFQFYSETSTDVTKVDKEKMDAIKFVAISSGRSHFIALDDQNNLYSWDTKDLEHGVQIAFEGIDIIESPIIKIACGWDFSCVFIYNIGLVVWKDRAALEKGELISKANYEIIPGTSELNGDNKILDFACMKDKRVLFITSNSDRLWDYHDNTVTAINIPISDKIIKITACFSSLILFTVDQCFNINIQDNDLDFANIVNVKLDDPDDYLVSLASGDFHSIGLTLKGHVYAWGLESQLCGCLGLGLPDHIVLEEEVGIYEEHGRNIRVTKPTKINLGEDYIAIAIAAGGWQSGALVIKK